MDISGFDKKYVVIAIVLLILGAFVVVLNLNLLGSGTESDASVTPLPTPEVTTTVLPSGDVCGNGVLEASETSVTCCVDAGCPVDYVCQDDSCVPTVIIHEASFAEPFWMGSGDVVNVEGLVEFTADSVSSFAVTWPDGSVTSESIATGESITNNYVTIQVVSVVSEKASVIVSSALAEKAPGEFINLFADKGVFLTDTNLMIGLKSVNGEKATVEVIEVGKSSREVVLGVDESVTADGYEIQLLTVRENGSVMFVVVTA